jgi:response regulator RpfG family c-di-GMP phosphodiesterase
MAVLRKVPEMSARILGHMRTLETEVQIVRHQHEYFNGTGLPSGLKGEDIPLGSRILHVAEAFEALTSDRVYRERMSAQDAVHVLQQASGTQFDPMVVQTLRQAMHEREALWMEHIQAARQHLDALGGGYRHEQIEVALVGNDD